MRHLTIQPGTQFGHLTVIRESVFKNQSLNMQFWCECICGEMCSINGSSLRVGNNKSCGCLQNDLVRIARTTHGRRYTPEYRAYYHAKNRCNNPKDIDYEGYGGRGIQFQFTSFEEFYKEVGNRPPGMTLDRKDNEGHYTKGNVRWATRSEQAFNRRPKGSNMAQSYVTVPRR